MIILSLLIFVVDPYFLLFWSCPNVVPSQSFTSACGDISSRWWWTLGFTWKVARDNLHCVFNMYPSINQAAYLEVLIEEHHWCFAHLYPGRPIIPKMHCMVHLPHIIIRYVYIANYICHLYIFFNSPKYFSALNVCWQRTKGIVHCMHCLLSYSHRLAL